MLPSGPVMLPGVIPALVNLGALTPSEFAADLVESQEWTCFPGLEECHEYAESIVDQFFAALSDTAIDFQTDVWLLLVAANDPALASWATRALATGQPPRWPIPLDGSQE